MNMKSSESSPITARLVTHVVNTPFAAIDAEAVAAAKTFILDSFGVALSGTRVPLVRELAQVAGDWGHGSACRVWGTGERVPAASAAFLNGYQIHNQEWDCVHEPAVVHPMAVVLATLVAWAEARGGVSGRELIRGCVLAVDVATSIGAAARNKLRFFRPAMCGALGATAGIAAMRGLDEQTTRSALGLAYSQLSGTMQAHVEGSAMLPIQIGFNARSALAAVDMAMRGIVGPRHFLEGPFGYFALMDNEWDPIAFDGLGQQFRITELSHKPFPSGRATHGGVDGMLTLRERHSFSNASLRQIRLIAPPLVIQLVARPPTPNMAPSYARLCAPYVVATALLNGTVGVGDFEPTAIADPARQSLALRVQVVLDANTALNALAPQRIEADLDDGRCLAIDLPAVLGAPGRPLTRDQHLAKFRLAASSGSRAFSPAAAERTVALVDRLDEMQDIRQLVDSLMFAR